jgi:hypothetical protein
VFFLESHSKTIPSISVELIEPNTVHVQMDAAVENASCISIYDEWMRKQFSWPSPRPIEIARDTFFGGSP